MEQEADQSEWCSPVFNSSNAAVTVSMDVLSEAQLSEKLDYLQPGGHYIPNSCSSKYRVAIVVPYRDRESHLHVLLNNFHPFLTDQQLDYSIIVVEQAANQTFNRGKLLNVGFIESIKLYDWHCFIFHDVDLLPEDRRNLHTCPEANPRHMAVAIDKFNYRLFYDGMFGTSCALTVRQFLNVNGFSNRFWGWGGEDDDMYARIISAGYKVERYNTSIARYKMIKHGRDSANPVNPCRYKLLNKTKRDWRNDGLSSLRYKLLNVTLEPLYTHILVDLLEAEEKPLVNKQFC
ncbi:hypothetical protein Aduo_017108 [Ancylostoma duodenale]